MTVIALTGGKGSPGATTLALALAANTPSAETTLLIEADPAGGDIAARAGLRLDPGLLTLAAAGRRGLTRAIVESHAQCLPCGALALVGPTSADQATTAVANVGAVLARCLELEQMSVIVDVGRWEPRSPAIDLVRSATVIAVVLRPTIEGVEHARWQLTALSDSGARLVAVTVGERPYSSTEVRAALGVDELHVVDHDARAANALGAGAQTDRWLRRSPLLRSANALFERLDDGAEEAAVTQ